LVLRYENFERQAWGSLPSKALKIAVAEPVGEETYDVAHRDIFHEDPFRLYVF
jgi:hypothetical protein